MGFSDMSAREALRYIKAERMLLPDIQRTFKWTMSDIEKLFESIADDYPIGFYIFWKTTKSNLNEKQPNLYHFVTEYERWKTQNKPYQENFDDDGNDCYIVLDGQQRLTALNIALYGYYSEKKRGRGYGWDNPKSWIRRRLYYNLDFHSKHDASREDEESTSLKRFKFLSDDEARDGNYYQISKLITFNVKEKLEESLEALSIDEESKNDLIRVFKRLESNREDSVIHYYEINNKSYDSALDIFVRVNSTGQKLSKSDLLFSTLINGWKDGREKIDKLIKSINSCKGEHFHFTRDYLMRLCLVLIEKDTSLKIEAFKKDVCEEIKNNWGKIEDTCQNLSELLVEFGYSDENLTSYNATMPIAYYIYNGGSFDSKESKTEERKFLAISMVKGLFGGSSDYALARTRQALQSYGCKNKFFNLNIFKEVILSGGRTFKVSEGDINLWLDNFVKGQQTYIILCLLYPFYKLSRESFHQDHCHPFNSFKKKNLKQLSLEEKENEWQEKCNKLPNLQLLEGYENEHKNKMPLKDWIDEGNKIKYDPSTSYELKDFETFFEGRRKLMKAELMKIFEITPTK